MNPSNIAAPTETRLPGLYALELPTPFPVGTVNAYLCVPPVQSPADKLTLIDCGVNTEDSYAALAAQLGALGYQVRDLQRLLITHHHGDHLGLAGRLAAESGADVIAHPQCVPYLETPHAARERDTRFTSVLFRENGVPEHLIAFCAQADAYIESLVSSAPVTQTLDEGDTFMLAGRVWHALHTPGHAGDILCFLDPMSGVLLSSDHILRDISSNPLIEPPAAPAPLTAPRPHALLDYMAQQQRVAALRPTLAYTGHGGPIDDVPALIETRFVGYRKRSDKLKGMVADGPQTLYELSRKLFEHIDETQTYLTLSETLGHLDWLERDGHVNQQRRDDGVIVFALTA